ncbi:hypothetical protein PQX77_014767 [Marasmius sp. AFHP31]|nr:hypothetical protein PQX77_014767 [Marasmius sp. AFHP31]
MGDFQSDTPQRQPRLQRRGIGIHSPERNLRNLLFVRRRPLLPLRIMKLLPLLPRAWIWARVLSNPSVPYLYVIDLTLLDDDEEDEKNRDEEVIVLSDSDDEVRVSGSGSGGGLDYGTGMSKEGMEMDAGREEGGMVVDPPDEENEKMQHDYDPPQMDTNDALPIPSNPTQAPPPPPLPPGTSNTSLYSHALCLYQSLLRTFPGQTRQIDMFLHSYPSNRYCVQFRVFDRRGFVQVLCKFFL